MSFYVMKYGGSSIGTFERIQEVAKQIYSKKQQGHICVVVVSAMGDTTDELIEMTKRLQVKASQREMDVLLSTGEQISACLLSMALTSLGVPAISLTGWQAGIVTDTRHGNACIQDIVPIRIQRLLEKGQVVIVAGFQGMSLEQEITTLGRGGSDTTAVALAASLQADFCEIYTDVDGIYSADPRKVSRAQKLSTITYDEMLELAHLGAVVLHPRAVEYAKEYQVKTIVRSSFRPHEEGTLIQEAYTMEQLQPVRGVACDKNIARITIRGVSDKPGILAEVFSALATEQIDVDMIIQSRGQKNQANFSFTTDLSSREKALHVLEELRSDIPYQKLESEVGIVKISIVGSGMVSHPGVAAKMFKAISDLNVSIKMVSTSEIKCSCVVEEEKLNEILLRLHTVFELDAQEVAYIGGKKERR